LNVCEIEAFPLAVVLPDFGAVMISDKNYAVFIAREVLSFL